MKVVVKAILALFLMSTAIAVHGEESIFVPFNLKGGEFCADFDEGKLCSTKIIKKDGKSIVNFKNKMICSIYKEDTLQCSIDPACTEKVSHKHGGDGAC